MAECSCLGIALGRGTSLARFVLRSVVFLWCVFFLEGLEVVGEVGRWGCRGLGIRCDFLYSHISWVTPWGSIVRLMLSVGSVNASVWAVFVSGSRAVLLGLLCDTRVSVHRFG